MQQAWTADCKLMYTCCFRPSPLARLRAGTGFESLDAPKTKGGVVVKLNVRDRESIQEAVRRFRKLVERSGIKKEMRRKEYYEKPSETRRLCPSACRTSYGCARMPGGGFV